MWWEIPNFHHFQPELFRIHINDSTRKIFSVSTHLTAAIKFREVLGEEFVITKGLDGCLFVYDNQEWNAFEEKLKALPLNKKDNRQFVRFFLAGAAEVEVDKQGRILVPGNLRDFAGLEKDVVLVGVASRIEIWSKAKWDGITEDEDEAMEDIAERMADLGLGI